MFLVNGMKAKLIQFNRTDNDSIYDDQNKRTITIKCCPYNAEQAINFGVYTHPEATGYYQVARWIDVREGDQIIFNGETHTILKVQEEYLFNRIENKILVVK